MPGLEAREKGLKGLPWLPWRRQAEERTEFHRLFPTMMALAAAATAPVADHSLAA
jgi:hypothetical protein